MEGEGEKAEWVRLDHGLRIAEMPLGNAFLCAVNILLIMTEEHLGRTTPVLDFQRPNVMFFHKDIAY